MFLLSIKSTILFDVRKAATDKLEIFDELEAALWKTCSCFFERLTTYRHGFRLKLENTITYGKRVRR